MLPMHSTATGSSGSACCPCTVQLLVAVAVHATHALPLLPVASIALAGLFGDDCILLRANFEKLASGFIHAVRTVRGGGGAQVRFLRSPPPMYVQGISRATNQCRIHTLHY